MRNIWNSQLHNLNRLNRQVEKSSLTAVSRYLYFILGRRGFTTWTDISFALKWFWYTISIFGGIKLKSSLLPSYGCELIRQVMHTTFTAKMYFEWRNFYEILHFTEVVKTLAAWVKELLWKFLDFIESCQNCSYLKEFFVKYFALYGKLSKPFLGLSN